MSQGPLKASVPPPAPLAPAEPLVPAPLAPPAPLVPWLVAPPAPLVPPTLVAPLLPPAPEAPPAPATLPRWNRTVPVVVGLCVCGVQIILSADAQYENGFSASIVR